MPTESLLNRYFNAVISMPFNTAFSWAACTPGLVAKRPDQRVLASIAAIGSAYRKMGVSLLCRDVAIRMSYTGFLFTIYRAVERRVIDGGM